ncbi:MAG: hypothetical protein BWZ10_02097 [candidate division BRC1 bacterium ADurb.BinA364]|nr:MAG: hypothetical protein BWZ10_02097 [candidate division BRC1 bacterium ADurb.BinA364]
MSFKKTILLAAIFAIFAGAYYWESSRVKQKEAKEDLDAQVLKADAKSVDKLTIENANGLFELVNAKDGDKDNWRILKPVETKGDDTAISNMIAILAGARKSNVFDLTGELKAADYGLEKPELSVKIEASSEGAMETFSVGDKGPGYSDYYGRVSSDETKAFLVGAHVKSSIEKTLFDLRDKTILSSPADKVSTVTLTQGGVTLHAEKKDGKWEIAKPVADFGNSEKFGELLRKVDGGKAADFIDTTGTLNLAQYGLDDPQIEMTVWGEGMDEAQTLFVGDQQPEEERYYAMRKGLEQVFMIPKDVHDALVVDAAEYRSKDLFNQVASSFDVGRIGLKSDKGEFTLVKDDQGGWAIEEEPGIPVDDAKADDLAAALTDLRIARIVTDSPTTSDTLDMGFNRPALVVELADEKGKAREKAVIGRFDEENRVLYAQREGAPTILELEWAERNAIAPAMDDLAQRLLAPIQTTDVQAIDLETMEDGEAVPYRFEKADGRWKARRGDEGEMKSAPEIEVASFVNTVSELRYKEKYEPGSDSAELMLAPLDDIETTMTLRNKDGQPLLDVSVTTAQFDLRFARARDGSCYSIESGNYQKLSDAIKTLAGVLPKEEDK